MYDLRGVLAQSKARCLLLCFALSSACGGATTEGTGAAEPPSGGEVPAPEVSMPRGAPRSIEAPGPIRFTVEGGAVFTADSFAALAIVRDQLIAQPDISLLRIEGHTSNVGRPVLNQTLSELRAMAVARWLIGEGIRCSRLLPVGFGDTRPIADNSTEEGRAMNERIGFVVVGRQGQPSLTPADGGGRIAGDPCK